MIKRTLLTVTFQWKQLECFEENGPITGYRYRAYIHLSNYTEGEVDRNTRMVTLFHKDMQAFSVAAMNKVGIGEHCPAIEPHIMGVHGGNESM